MNGELGIIEIGDSIAAMALIMETERLAHLQRDLDGQGCDEGCGLCGAHHPEVICWFHVRAASALPRRMEK